MANRSLRSVLALGVGGAVVSLLVLATMLRAQLAAATHGRDETEARGAAIAHDADLHLRALLDEESSLRGYLATGDRRFLAQIESSSGDARATLSSLRARLGEDDAAALGPSVSAVEEATDRWTRDVVWADLEARAHGPLADLDGAIAVEHDRFEEVRALHVALGRVIAAHEADDLRVGDAQLRRADIYAAIVAVLFIVATLVVLRYVVRNTVHPLVELAGIAERGDPFPAPARSPIREIGALAGALHRLDVSSRERALRDPLTGAYNRNFLDEYFSKQLAAARRRERPLAVLMLDLDDFKKVNDGYGHAAGDRALALAAGCLHREVRTVDAVVRYGGEEFVVLLPETPLDGALVVAERIRAALSCINVDVDGKKLGGLVRASIGVATFPEHGEQQDDLLRAADRALYRAKAAGRNRVVTAQPSLAPTPVGKKLA